MSEGRRYEQSTESEDKPDERVFPIRTVLTRRFRIKRKKLAQAREQGSNPALIKAGHE